MLSRVDTDGCNSGGHLELGSPLGVGTVVPGRIDSFEYDDFIVGKLHFVAETDY